MANATTAPSTPRIKKLPTASIGAKSPPPRQRFLGNARPLTSQAFRARRGDRPHSTTQPRSVRCVCLHSVNSGDVVAQHYGTFRPTGSGATNELGGGWGPGPRAIWFFRRAFGRANRRLPPLARPPKTCPPCSCRTRPSAKRKHGARDGLEQRRACSFYKSPSRLVSSFAERKTPCPISCPTRGVCREESNCPKLPPPEKFCGK